MSASDSDSSAGSPVTAPEEKETPEQMFITVDAIPTIAKLYGKEVLKRAETERYPFNKVLLERVSLFQGDITRLKLDCIVNAANKSLLGGGGVDGAIHSAAGPKLLEECRTLNGCMTGQSKITRGYNIPASHIIHTVGPVYSESAKEEKAELLASCYRTSLELAVENSLRHIAFPSVSTGIYGYPIADATDIALDEVRKFLETENGSKLERVILVVWSDRDKGVYQQMIPGYFPPPPEGDIAADGEVEAEDAKPAPEKSVPEGEGKPEEKQEPPVEKQKETKELDAGNQS
ncbi:A1pp-domain-containing protein [Pluteus cervinus]|uniref:A1pp-domain-containing protein n=1 Tax=Pluteus cervinus TaxID=181527 RepID=A0ACD3BDS0_9AGAR|nr:A1pp-domain-containing protein [Pluteus cervinus]